MNPLLVVTLLDAVLMLVSRVPSVVVRIQAVQQEIAAMQAAGRDPTPEEDAAIAASIDARLARLNKKLPPPS